MSVVAAMLTLVDATLRFEVEARARRHRADVVAILRLSDLGLFTKARYTRPPAAADLHSAFQDHPAAIDHNPSAAWIPPRNWHEPRS